MIRCPVCQYTLPAPREVIGSSGSPITDLDSHVAAVHPDHPITYQQRGLEVPAGATVLLDGYVIGSTTEPLTMYLYRAERAR